MTFFLVYCFFGILYSCLFPAFGGWFSHYVALFSVVHSLVLGLTVGVVGYWLTRLFSSRWVPRITVGVLLGIHSAVWLVLLSPLSSSSPVLLSIVPAGVAFLVMLGSLAVSFFSRVLRWPRVTFLLGAVVLVVLKGVVVMVVPVSSIGNGAVYRVPSPDLTVTDVVYPLSVPLDESLSRYRHLVSMEPSEPPVILFVVDALRKDFTGVEFAGQAVTPRIDSVAEDGVRMNRYYVQQTWTGSSTASLFTGKYPHEHGLCLLRAEYGQRLPDRYRTLAERFRSDGYHTAGTSFAVHLDEKLNFTQGFDFWISPQNHHRHDVLSLQKLLLSLVRSRPGKLFLYVHVQGPHAPYKKGLANSQFWEGTEYARSDHRDFEQWNLPSPGEFSRTAFETWSKNHPNRNVTPAEIRLLRHFYASQLNFSDRQHVGRFLRGMKALGLYEPSLFTLTADHGEALLDGEYYGSPPRAIRRFGHLNNLRETVINPPLVVKPPRGVDFSPGGFSENGILESVDLASTILDFAGLSSGGMSGESFLDHLRGESQKSDKTFRDALTQTCGITEAEVPGHQLGNYNRDQLHELLKVSRVALTEKNWKFLYDYPKGESYLFDLRKPLQKRRAEKQFPEVQLRMEERLRSVVPSDSAILNVPGGLVPRSKEEIDELKGLGYLN